MNFNRVALGILCILISNIRTSVQLYELKCLVCKQVINEITKAVHSEDPRKKIQVGSFRIQPDGSQKQSQIKYAGSELHLNEIFESVCSSLENFAQAKHKETGEMVLLNLSKDVEKLDIYELIPDPDLNRSLKYYCENFIEDHEDDIVREYKTFSDKENTKLIESLCFNTADYCSSYHSEL